MPAKMQAAVLALGGKMHMPCMDEPGVLNSEIENRLLTAFASNPACHGIKFFQGYYGPDSSSASMQEFSSAQNRLALNLSVSEDNGKVSLKDSDWTMFPRVLSGSLADLDKAATHICAIAKGEGSTEKTGYATSQ